MKLMPDLATDDADSMLVLPAADSTEVGRNLAAAPVVDWFRALAGWAAEGRTIDVDMTVRVPRDAVADLGDLLGLDEIDAGASTTLVDVAVRWALQARLLRLRTGVLRAARQNLSWLDDPAQLWFRAVGALVRPDNAFTDLLAEYGGSRRFYYSLDWALGDLVACVAEGPFGDQELVAAYGARFAADYDPSGDVRVLGLLAQALGLIAREHESGDPATSTGWMITGLGRVFHALRRLPSGRASGEDDPSTALSLVGQPEDTPEPRLVVKVILDRHRVWRRLSVPGGLTMHGLHLAVQTSFGWDDDHLHVFHAGPFRFAPGYVELDDAVPSELVTMTDLAALGIRELAYRYDLGDCWDHEIVIEKVLTGGGVLGIGCVAGAGTTPAEDGQDWYEDEDGRMIHNPVPEPERVYDLARINRALASLIDDPDDDQSVDHSPRLVG